MSPRARLRSVAPPTGRKPINLMLPFALVDRIDAYAAVNRRSRTGAIEWLLMGALDGIPKTKRAR